jgi:hypothetical protein
MNTKLLIEEINTEIIKLQKARAALLTIEATPVKGKRARPKGSTSKKASKKRSMSSEGRAKIAAAQKKRWAAAKKTA